MSRTCATLGCERPAWKSPRPQGGGRQSIYCEQCATDHASTKRRYKDKRKGRDRTLAKHAGIGGRDGYLVALILQGGSCAGGCGATVADSTGSPLHIDHDHDHDPRHPPGIQSCDGCRRGLLCGKCNRLIGLAGDDPTILRTLADYLERFRARSFIRPGFRYLESTESAA